MQVLTILSAPMSNVSHHILLIDDSEDEYQIIRLALQQTGLGARLHWIDNVVKARDFAPSGGEPLSLILLDYRVPTPQAAFDFLRWAGTRQHLKRTPIILLSNGAPEADISLALEMGVSAFVLKPSRLDEFSEVLAKTISEWCEVPHA